MDRLVNAFRSELDYLEKHFEKVEDESIRRLIKNRVKDIYDNLEDVVILTYHNRKVGD